MSKVRLIGKSQGMVGTEYEGKSIDEIIVGIARLSSSREVNELFAEPDKLLRHCLLNAHWSVFTSANLVIEIITSRAIGRDLLRHWGLKPQEFSQRYAEVQEIEPIEIRKKSLSNRQSSTEPFGDEIISFSTAENTYGDGETVEGTTKDAVEYVINIAKDAYDNLVECGASTETARFLLPEAAQTKIVFNGSIREWITTLNLRLHKTAQKEAVLIAEEIRDILIKECPVIAKALYNFEDAYDIHILERMVLEKYGCYNIVKSNGFHKVKWETTTSKTI